MPAVVPPPRPPMSTSSLPGSVRPFPVRVAPVAPPILASDILREEVAPRAPAKRAVRAALAAFAATFALGALAAEGLLGPVRIDGARAFEASAGAAGVALLAAGLPLGYTARAALATLAAAWPLALGALGAGPLAPLGVDGALPAATFAVMGTVLPAALVFRARYRAYVGARTLLAIALVVSLPAVVALARAALSGDAALGTRVIAGVAVAGAAASTLGFMGPETSAGCAQWAAIVVGALVARPAARAIDAAWSGRDAEMIAGTAAALGDLVASTLLGLALFQLFAAAFGARARATANVHEAIGAGKSEEPEREE